MGSPKQIGKDIKEAREKAGLTQVQVAEKIGVHFNYFAKIERGEVSASQKRLRLIGKLLKISISL